MAWNIIMYRSTNGRVPVANYIKELPANHQHKAVWHIDLLKKYGTELREPYAKPINGKEYHGIWELRIIFSGDISRILYFAPMADTFVLLHGFTKKTNKTPKLELDKAKQRMQDYLRRL